MKDQAVEKAGEMKDQAVKAEMDKTVGKAAEPAKK